MNPMDSDPKERREYERIPFREEILIDGITRCAGVDISEGGLYVCTVQLFEEHSLIDVTLPLKEGTLRVKARVRYCQPGIGIGVEFILNDEQREKIRDFICGGTAECVRPEAGKSKILLIEENDISGQYKKRLAEEGFSVVEAKDIVEAMRILSEQTPDLIILDLYMKKMDGFKVLSILKTNPKWKDLPVIVCSTSGTEDVMKKVIDAGADEFLNKMMTPASQLLDVVRTVLKRSIKTA